VSQRLGAEVLDVGAGRGGDSLWLARQGISVTAYDYVPGALARASERAEEESLDLTVRQLNLTEWRSVYAEGARLAHTYRPRVILANHVVDATSGVGREALARLCSMALRQGGHLFAEFYVRDDEDSSADGPEWMVGKPDVEAFTRLLRDAGASKVDVTTMRKRGRPTVRLVGVW
jgi:SAM-dependent methyltransferase